MARSASSPSAKRAMKGRYLQYKNPSDAMEREVVRLGNLLDDYSGGESGDLDYIFGSAPVADRLDAAVAACQEYDVPDEELMAARKMLGLKSNPRSASSPSAKRATKPAGRRSMSPEQRHRADLVDQMVATGRYTRAVAERILDRMPHALDPIPARVTESVEVTTGFGTKWTYALHKVAGGYTVTFRPVDVDARRKSGTGSTGGFISGTTLSGVPKVYRTQKEAYEAVVAHAGRGQYLLKKNPPREFEFRGMPRGMEAIPLKVIKAKSNVQAMGRSYAKHMEEADRADNLAMKQKHRAKAFAVEKDAGAFIEDIAEQVDESSQRQAKGILYSEFRAYSGMTRNPRTFRGVKRAGNPRTPEEKARRKAAFDLIRLQSMGPKKFEAYQASKADARRLRPLENAAFAARRALKDYKSKYGGGLTQTARRLSEALREAKHDLVLAGGKVSGNLIGEKEVTTKRRRAAK